MAEPQSCLIGDKQLANAVRWSDAIVTVPAMDSTNTKAARFIDDEAKSVNEKIDASS
jgi:hypothetical protein